MQTIDGRRYNTVKRAAAAAELSEVEFLLRHMREHETTERAAQALDIHPTTLKRHLDRNGITCRRVNRWEASRPPAPTRDILDELDIDPRGAG